ncbi:MAG: HTTM domain-containing protein [Opitutae bacterium]|nr:HTTM domain-containing protein [Opitutae bacterium]
MKAYLLDSFVYLLILGLLYSLYRWRLQALNPFLSRIRESFPPLKSPRIVSLFRIVHSLLTLVIAFQLIELIPFTFYAGDKTEISSVYYALHALWILGTILAFLGTRFRAVYILNFILAYMLLGTNVGDFMLKLAAFWMIFILPVAHFSVRKKELKLLGLDRIPDTHTQPWAVYLMGVNLAFIITIAGLFKLIDPVWLNGLGFYYSYLQPWIHVEWTHFVLDFEWIMYVMNYLGIIFESAALFLFLFKKTRIWGIFMMATFIGLVNFPLRIDPVGPAGLAILIALMAFYPVDSLLKRKPDSQKASISTLNPSLSNYIMVLSSVILVFQAVAGLNNNWQRFKYPLIGWPFVYEEQQEEENPSASSKAVSSLLYVKNQIVEGISKISLQKQWEIVNYPSIFGFNHSFARGFYRVFSDGPAGEHELIRVFTDEGKVPSAGDRSGFMKPLNLHVVYGQLGILYYKVAKYKSLKALDGRDRKTLKNLLHFSAVRYERKTRKKAKKSQIFINPILVPKRYMGRFSGAPKDWNLVINYNHVNQDMKLDRVSDYKANFDQIEISGFREGRIKFFLELL